MSTSKTETLDEFLAHYNEDGAHPVIEVDVPQQKDGASPFIVIRHGDFAVIVNPMGLGDHLCVDVHSWVNDKDATAGVFGMSKGRRWQFADKDAGGPGTTSHGWPSASLVSVLVGEQAGEQKGPWD